MLRLVEKRVVLNEGVAYKFCAGERYFLVSFLRNALATKGGTILETSPLSAVISLTREELTKMYFSEGIRKIVSIRGASLWLVKVSCSS